MISTSILILAVAACLAPFVHRATRAYTGVVLAALPLALGCWLATLIPTVAGGGSYVESVPWVLNAPGLGVELSFRLDGLGLTFAVLISFIGALVLVYASKYMEGHAQAGRFFAYLTGFMVSMLGLVMSDNIIMLFVFWELTSITSYLLIGFDHHREKARKAAWQALLTTGLGGLLMLAGLVLIGVAAGEAAGVTGGLWNLSEITAQRITGATSGLYGPALVLLLCGCFTKSAQFPFHYWLPNAMEGPSPVSALLHSSTMVKAGVYLLARLTPTMGGDPAWLVTLTVVGAFTMAFAAFMATRETYLKKVLAYSTVSSLGILVMLIGLSGVPSSGGKPIDADGPGYAADVGQAAEVNDFAPVTHAVALVGDGAGSEAGAAGHSDAAGDGHAGAASGAHDGGHGKGDKALSLAQYAAAGMMTYLIAHALFKAALFLAAGAVTHQTGEKDTEKLGGLYKKMPITAICTLVSAASMAGLPPLFGFVGKEAVLHAGFASHGWFAWLVVPMVAAGAVCTVLAAIQVGWRPFFMAAKADHAGEHHHSAVGEHGVTVAHSDSHGHTHAGSQGHGHHDEEEPEDHGHHAAGPVREPHPFLWLGVALLTVMTVAVAWAPGLWPHGLIEAGISSLTGAWPLKSPATAWYSGFLHFDVTVAAGLLISAGALSGGWWVYHRALGNYRRFTAATRAFDAIGPERWYWGVYDGVIDLAAKQTKFFQNGRLVAYVRVVMLTLLGLGLLGLSRAVSWPELLASFRVPSPLSYPVEYILSGMVLVTCVAAALGQSRLATVVMLGVIGYSIAVLFVMHGAPDLAMTQFAVETLTVVLFVLVLFKLPRFRVYSGKWTRVVDLGCALLFGAMITGFVLASNTLDPVMPISEYHAANSYAATTAGHAGNGRNIVNVIIVDFRGLDTLGEITVLGIAAFGVLTLLTIRPPRPLEPGLGEGLEDRRGGVSGARSSRRGREAALAAHAPGETTTGGGVS